MGRDAHKEFFQENKLKKLLVDFEEHMLLVRKGGTDGAMRD